jgi:dipeptidyl aminopeptidase/acylaminoacyl peptidase
MRKVLLLSVLLISFFTTYSQENPKTFTFEDSYLYSRFNGIDISPDGRKISYSLGEKEKWNGNRNYNIWLALSSDNSKIKFTNSDKDDWDPQWSPDGSKIAFLSSRSERTQVYVISANGGEAQEITFVQNGINFFHWIDNNTIAFVSDEPRDTNLVNEEENAGGGYVVGTTYCTSALWTQTIDNIELKKITHGDYYISDMAAASDGKSFLLITAKNSDLFLSITESIVLWVDEIGNEIMSFEDAKNFSNPAVSPDNSKACFVGNTVGYSINNALFVMDKENETVKNLTEEFDPTIKQLKWIDSDHISFKTPRNVHTGIYSVDMSGHIETILEPYYVVDDYSLNPNTKEIVFVGSTYNIPNEVFVNKFNDNPENALKLTSVTDWITKKNLGKSKVISYLSGDGTKIEAVLTLPYDYEEGKSYPLLVLPHGGPDGISMDKFDPKAQLFSQLGLIVFEPNFRGSIGYGSEFYAANRGKLGYIDYNDIMTGLDNLIKNKYADSDKLVVGGWSYGGYMTNWIIAHTKRFVAAVSVAGISNTVSNYAQSDINHGEVADWEFEGVPVYDKDKFEHSSPFDFLNNIGTPLLLMHGEADTRVSVMQSWEIYRALIDRSQDVELVLYPGAEHGITSPKQHRDVMRRWIAWYNKYLE